MTGVLDLQTSPRGSELGSRPSGEIAVVREAGVRGALQEAEQSGALVRSRAPPNHDDDAGMWPLRAEREEVVAIAGDKDESVPNCIFQHGRVKRIPRKRIAQERDAVPEVGQQIAQVVGDIIVKEEGPRSAGDICHATSTSISPRWSS